jgi:hypothetical protein
MRATWNAARTGRVPRPAVYNGASVPAPVEGWDAVSPIAQMKPTRAVRMVNWFPQPDWVEIRRGYIEHCDTGTGLPVETVAAYQSVDGANKLFAISDGTIFDVTSGTASPSVTMLANSRFQQCSFATTGGNFLYMVNGADIPQYFDGTSWATATITGSGISSSDFIGVIPHKNRLWFTIADSSDAAYLPVDSIQGVAAKFPLGGNWYMGGYLMAICSWSLDAGDGPDDYIAFISSQGQVSVYKGTDPATNFTLVGTYYTGAPIGRRCFTKVGADIALICVDGVVPLSKALIYERGAVQKVSLTERIQRVMTEAARNYKGNFGWQLISYPRGTRAILNVPEIESGTQVQYVMNTLNGAWCKFENMNANCWELYQDRPFFGGNTGVVYEADRGGSDAVGVLTADMMTAYNYFNTRGAQKRWMMCRTLLTTDLQIVPGMAFNVDFQTDAPIITPSTEAFVPALWDVAEWDDAVWGGGLTTQGEWNTVTGLGYCASIRLVAQVLEPSTGGTTGEVVLQVNGWDLSMEKGAMI